MYVILAHDDNTLSAPVKQRIVQRSKLVDTMWFLVKPVYNGHDLSSATVLLEYLKPTSKKYETEVLRLAKDKYEDHLKYVLPVDTKLTDEAGSLELQLSFLYVDIDPDGNPVQKVRKTAPALKVEIVPISAWSDIIPDGALSVIDQRLLKVDAQIKALDDMNTILIDGKADDLTYDNNKLQLLANGKRIGSAVNIASGDGCGNEDGVPVIDFSTVKDEAPDELEHVDNVVEF